MIATQAILFSQQYVLNMHTRQIHDTTKASGKCGLTSLRPERIVESGSLRVLRNYNTNSAQMRGRLNKICTHCIGA